MTDQKLDLCKWEICTDTFIHICKSTFIFEARSTKKTKKKQQLHCWRIIHQSGSYVSSTAFQPLVALNFFILKKLFSITKYMSVLYSYKTLSCVNNIWMGWSEGELTPHVIWSWKLPLVPEFFCIAQANLHKTKKNVWNIGLACNA